MANAQGANANDVENDNARKQALDNNPSSKRVTRRRSIILRNPAPESNGILHRTVRVLFQKLRNRSGSYSHRLPRSEFPRLLIMFSCFRQILRPRGKRAFTWIRSRVILLRHEAERSPPAQRKILINGRRARSISNYLIVRRLSESCGLGSQCLLHPLP